MKSQIKQAIIELWRLIRPHRGLMAWSMLLLIVNRAAGFILPASTKYLVDDVILRKDMYRLREIVAIVVVATLLQGITSLVLSRSLSKSSQELIAETRRRLQKHIGHLPLAYYDHNKTGIILSRIMWDVDGISKLMGTGLVDFLGALLTAALAFVFLTRISPLMTSIVFIYVVLITVVLSKGLMRIRDTILDRRQTDAEVIGRLAETLSGVRVVKGYHAEDREHAVFSHGVERMLKKMLGTTNTAAMMSFLSTILIGLVGAATIYVGVREIIIGRLTIGGYFTYTVFATILVAPMQQMVTIGVLAMESLAGLERTREILDLQPEDADPRRAILLPNIIGAVQFENVSFGYGDGREVLHNVSFSSQPGTVTALIGPSGSGKSTIIGLLAAFYKPETGRILVDNFDVSDVRLDSYRTKLGLVLQDSFLFDGSIRENVAFSRPNASEDEILRACKIARVDQFADRFANGYDTIIGERGIKLSGGERQRVSIARAILADPRILILDEATSSLDSESEALIQAGLSFLMRGRTTFVIAHRLSTIRLADQILVVENGEIVERGVHDELYARRGRYFDLYTRQRDIEGNLFLAPGEGDPIETSGDVQAGDVPTEVTHSPL
jgi:ABC-type multidrug transport system fused ATPase/permease subunit